MSTSPISMSEFAEMVDIETLPMETVTADFVIRAYAILMDIKLPNGWKTKLVGRSSNGAMMIFVRVGDPNGVCNMTGAPLVWWGRDWRLSQHMTDGEIVQTIFKACETAAEHEMREQFLYKGVSIFDPHYDIDKLIALRSRPDALKERD